MESLPLPGIVAVTAFLLINVVGSILKIAIGAWLAIRFEKWREARA